MANKKKKKTKSAFEVLDQRRNEQIAQMSKGSTSTYKKLNKMLAPSSKEQISTGSIKTNNQTSIDYASNNTRDVSRQIIAPTASTLTSNMSNPVELVQNMQAQQQNEKLKMPSELLQEKLQKQFEEKQQKSKEASEKRVEQKKKDEKEEDPDTIYQNKVLKNVMSEYSGLSKEKLLKLREENIKQQKKIMEKGDYKTQNRKWWNSDDNILENAGNVLYKLFAEQDPYTFSDEYNELIAREMAIQKAIEGKTLEDKKYDKGVAGGLEKVGDALASGFMRGTRGIEDTAKKILGQEESKTEELPFEDKEDK